MRALGLGRNLLICLSLVVGLAAATTANANVINTIQAETYSDGLGVRTRTDGDWYTGSGWIDFVQDFDQVEWNNVEVTESGFYGLTIHYRGRAWNSVKFDVFVNGTKTSKQLKFIGVDDGVANYDLDRTIRIIMPLNAGANTVKFDIHKAYYNSPYVDRLEISTIDALKTDLATSLTTVNDHILGNTILNDTQWAEHKTIIDDNLGVVAEGDPALVGLAMDLVRNYETAYGPMFLNAATRISGYGWDRRNFVPDVDTATLSVMQGIVDNAYGYAQNLVNLSGLMDGYMFRSSEHFPGKVTAVPNPSETLSAAIKCSFPDTYGRNYAFGDTPARKPTGLYLPPGTVATLTVPSAIVGKGYRVRVGAHDADVSNKPFVRRLDRSSLTYGIESTEMTLISPLGGSIHIEVPYLANDGIQTIQVKNVVRSPLFSLQSHKTTSLIDWQNEIRNYGAPWADFITEKFQYSVPTSWIYAVDDPKSILEDWNLAMDAVTDLMGFPHVRGKEHLYQQVDVIIRHGTLGTGYPHVNQTYSAYDSFTRHNGQNGMFIAGPLHGITHSELHEHGHAVGMQKFPGENESVNNLLYACALNRQFGIDLEEAWRRSTPARTDAYYTFDTAAMTWMTSEHFLTEESMIKPEMQYQFKGHARYVELARQFGWEAPGAYWKSIVDDEETGVDVDRSVDGLILRMSKTTGVDVTPLILFWGVRPVNPAQLMIDIENAGLKPSVKIYDMLDHYKSVIPADNAAFQAHAIAWHNGEPIQTNANYTTDYYHDQLFETYDEAYAAQVHVIMQRVIDTYFPNGRPDAGPQPPTVSFTSPADGDQVNETDDVIVTVDASDNSGIERVRLKLDDVNVTPLDLAAPYDWNLGKLSVGTHVLRVIAFANDIDPATGTQEWASDEISIEVLAELPTEYQLINVNIDNTAEVESSLDGPIFGDNGNDTGTTWNQILDPNAGAATIVMDNLLDSTGAATTIDIHTTSDKLWGRTHVTKILTAGASTWSWDQEQTLTISGLEAGALYDLYLCSFTSDDFGRCVFSTANITSTLGPQRVVNNLTSADSTAWVRGGNYAVFENVQPDNNQQIIITFVSDNKDSRAFLSGLQLVTAGTDRVAPAPATSPVPEDQAEGLPPETDLNWTPGTGAESYNVYLGTSPVLGTADLRVNQTATTFDPGTLAHGTYYWRVDSVNNEGTTTGTVWSFRVGPPAKAWQAMPAHMMHDVSLNATLRWEMGERAISSDVYFGTDSTPDSTEFKGNQLGTSFNPGTLSPNTTYFWRIDQVNVQGTMTSDVWRFTTGDTSSGKMKVFILAGQSNMEGHGELNPPETMGTLEYAVANDPATYGHLKSGDAWAVRDDVWMIYNRGADSVTELRGWHSVGYGAYDRTIGPELQFGNLIGDHFNEPVLLIKCAWGGRSLAVDFRPPSSGWRLDNPTEHGHDGYYYQLMMNHVVDVLNHVNAHFPSYAGNGFDVAGFGWHQGWNDLGSAESVQYQENMANFIKDVRTSLGKPALPFAIATTGMASGDVYSTVEQAQLAMGNTELYPEFSGNVAVRDTTNLMRSVDESPSSQGYHWNRNAESYYGVGQYLGEAMIGLLSTTTENSAPVIESQAVAVPTVIQLAESTTLSVAASDPDGDALSYTWSKASGLGTVTFAAKSAATTIAQFSEAGSYLLAVTVSDGSLSATSEVTVVVEAPVGKSLPSVEITSPQEGAQFLLSEDVVVAVQASDNSGIYRVRLKLDDVNIDPIGIDEPYEWNLGRLAVGTHELRVLAFANDIDPDTGTYEWSYDSVTIVITEAVSSAPVIVSEANAAPAIVDLADAVTELSVVAEDPDGDALTYSWRKTSGPGIVTFTNNGTASSDVTVAEFSAAGTYELEVVVSDGSLQATSVVGVTVVDNTVGELPTADDQSLTVKWGRELPIILTGAPAGANLTFEIVSMPEGGTLTGTAPYVTYKSVKGFKGTDSFTFKVNDGAQGSDIATITIEVTNQKPTGRNQTLQVSIDDSIQAAPMNAAEAAADSGTTFTLSGTDADGDELTFRIQSLPLNGTVSGTVPNLSYTPKSGFAGNDQLIYIINDGLEDSEPAAVEMMIASEETTSGSTSADEDSGGCSTGRGNLSNAWLIMLVAACLWLLRKLVKEA